ncbi:MAG: hypothetical protein WDM92_12355 [Caulobacteraceae bacterium]
MATTWQPYLELDWKPIDGLTIVPGVKYTGFHRSVDAAINKGTKLPLNYAESFNAWQAVDLGQLRDHAGVDGLRPGRQGLPPPRRSTCSRSTRSPR